MLWDSESVRLAKVAHYIAGSLATTSEVLPDCRNAFEKAAPEQKKAFEDATAKLSDLLAEAGLEIGTEPRDIFEHRMDEDRQNCLADAVIAVAETRTSILNTALSQSSQKFVAAFGKVMAATYAEKSYDILRGQLENAFSKRGAGTLALICRPAY